MRPFRAYMGNPQRTHPIVRGDTTTQHPETGMIRAKVVAPLVLVFVQYQASEVQKAIREFVESNEELNEF